MDANELIKKVRKIEIKTRGLSSNIFAGQYHSAFKGRGMAFSEVREYQYGDDVRDIDWNVTARSGTAHIKKYSEERELSVILAVDISRSGFFGTAGVEKRTRMAEVAALLALSAVRNHDKAGLLLFSDRTELYLPPRSGRTHVLRLVRELLAAEPQGRGTDLPGAVTSLNHSLKKRSVVFLISDFAAPVNYEKELKMLSRRHDTILIRVTDPLEHTFPAGLPGLVLTDAENGRSLTFSIRRKADKVNAVFAADTGKVNDLARRAKTDLIDLSTADADPVLPLMAFFHKRREGGSR